jgi:RNA polymerase sigma factor (sigma-70 family)
MAPASDKRLLPFLRELAGDADEATDGQLLERFLTLHQEAAFRALVDRHGPMVLGVCRRVLGNAHDAEDAFQATFLVLVRKAASVVPRELLANWLYGVAYRTAQKARVSRTRAHTARRRLVDRVTAMAQQARTEDEIWHDLQPVLDQELQRLPDKYRAAVVLCDLEGKPRKEAARQLGWPEGTLSGRLARARRLLAERLTRRGVTLSVAALAAALAKGGVAAAVPAALKTTVTQAALLTAGGQAVPAGVVSASVADLTEGVMKTMLMARLRVGVLLLAAVGLAMAGTGLVAHQVVAAGGQQPARADGANPQPPDRDGPADDQAQRADAELHVIGVSGAKQENGKRVDVEVRPTAKPVLLVLTSYNEVNWHVQLADGARVKKVLVSGYFPQEIQGLPADVPVENRSYFPNDGSRRQGGWFYAYHWNTPQWREMVRRLNDRTGLPVASFQGGSEGVSFVVDGSRGREFGQKQLKPRTPAPKEPTPQELLAASAGAELHVVGMYSPDLMSPGKPVDVEVRATAKPVVLVLTSYGEAVWNVKPDAGARIKAVLVGAGSPQEIDGLPPDVPVRHFCPAAASWYFDRRGPLPDTDSFCAHQWNTIEYRRMVERLNDLTGLLVATAQLEYTGTAFVVDGTRGRNFAQKERKPRPTPPKAPTPQELLTASAGADLHVIGIYETGVGNGTPVDVEVRSTGKPVVLVLTAYYSVLWNVKVAPGARVKAVIISGYNEQEFEGIPANIPRVCRSYYPSLTEGFFYAYQWNTFEYRRMVEKLNDMTGLLVSSFQGGNSGTSFVVDGTRGRNFAQKERKPRPAPPKELKPGELLAASAGADLHLVSIYGAEAGNGTPVDVEVRPTGKPVVLALVSYYSVLWNVKIAEGSRVKAVIIGGYYEQESEGIPAGIPLVYRTYFPSQNRDYFYGHERDTPEYRGVVERLNDLTGLLVATAQVEYKGTSFVVDGTRGREFAQKERSAPDPARKPPKPQEDPLADVADIPSQELQAAGDAHKRYFLIGPKKDAKPPAEGYGLVVILPGGDGSADFHPFVKRIYKHALSDRYVAAQPVAPKWTPDQQIVWPTKTNPVAGMKFATEEFVEAVIDDVAKKHPLDRTKVFTLSWSSSGPAAYATSLREPRRVMGSLVAMSVFNPQFLPPLKAANGHAYYLYHSRQDRVCPYRMAEQAQNSLTENGAKVHLATYEGGHGWRGNLYRDLRNGVEWLEKNRDKANRP